MAKRDPLDKAIDAIAQMNLRHLQSLRTYLDTRIEREIMKVTIDTYENTDGEPWRKRQAVWMAPSQFKVISKLFAPTLAVPASEKHSDYVYPGGLDRKEAIPETRSIDDILRVRGVPSYEEWKAQNKANEAIAGMVNASGGDAAKAFDAFLRSYNLLPSLKETAANAGVDEFGEVSVKKRKRALAKAIKPVARLKKDKSWLGKMKKGR